MIRLFQKTICGDFLCEEITTGTVRYQYNCAVKKKGSDFRVLLHSTKFSGVLILKEQTVVTLLAVLCDLCTYFYVKFSTNVCDYLRTY